MSRMLNVADRLLARARNYHRLGRRHEAARVLGQLARLRKLPADASEEVQHRLAELALDRRDYHQARRHLTAALARRPDDSHYHYLMAGALDEDPRGDAHRALDHYRKSLELQPDQPRCLAERGLLALRLGKTAEGLASLRRAVQAAPDSPSAVSSLVTGLRELGHEDDIRRVLVAALLRNPRDTRFRRLWDDYRFRRTCEEQARRDDRGRSDGEGPTLLPFRRPMKEAPRPGRAGLHIRRDGSMALPAPHLPGRSSQVPDRKHA